MNSWEEIKKAFRGSSYLNRLIYINLGFFVLVIFYRIILFLFKLDPEAFALSAWLGLPADMRLFFLKPWTLITSMFYHEQFFHILFNMLWLYWFGLMLMHHLGQKKLLSTYLLGGITGGGFYILAYSLFPVFSEVREMSIAYGASAAVSAVVIAMVVYRPNDTIQLIFLGPVKLKYIGIFYVLSDLFQLPMGNAGGHIAHLGGAFWGYYYISQAQKGIDRADWFEKLLDRFFAWINKKPRMHVSHKRTVTDYEYNAMKRAKQEEIDVILDKIQKSGYSSLSQKEKDLLFNASGKKN
jgi:membrane associated rhomboid family serine protease